MPHILDEKNIRPYTCEVAITQYAVVVEGTADGQVKLPGAADAGSIVGVAMEAGAIGDIIAVALPPSTVPCIASAAITRGVEVSIAAVTGTVKASAPAAGANSYLVGRAQNSVTTAGDQVSVQLCGVSIKQG